MFTFHTANTELVLINFYADWCKFSNMLEPIYDEAADKVAAEFTTPGKVVLAKVDCEKESESCSFLFFYNKPTNIDNVFGLQLLLENVLASPSTQHSRL